MILLKKVRLVNWYGFANTTAPIGFFTLIAGQNGNGKSVMLDAIKYAAYGDTVFNKSSDVKGGGNGARRTLSSYTRGLLNADTGTYMRPADQAPNVYTHIVLEYFDQVEEKPFLLGTVIETNPSNNCQTYRYVMDRTTLDQVEHVRREGERLVPYSPLELQKAYRLTLLNREQGLPRFLQMTGLKLSLSQLPTYLRKLRGILSYSPDAKIDQFIRESVLEQRDVDFGKLIEAKANIEGLNQSFAAVQEEIQDLDGILGEYDTWESERNRLLSDDIRLVYKGIQDLKRDIERLTRQRDQARQRQEDLAAELKILERRRRQVEEQRIQAQVSLERLDSARMIAEEKRRLEAFEAEKKELTDQCRRLEAFQTVISTLLHDFRQAGQPVENQGALASLCQWDHTAAQKAAAVEGFRQQVEAAYDGLVKQIAGVEQELEQVNQGLDAQHRILEECRKHRNTYGQIPEYLGLREEINRELERRKLPQRAQFACEYVIRLKDESWRDAIEAFLGPRRYTILVDPEVYDVADDVLNRSEHRYAHLFNTKLLMRKKVEPETDSVLSQLEIRNPVAWRYFAYQLGRMHGVELDQVRNYENAISREGRVSVAMDSYFLRFDRIRSYYLGQQVFQLNRRRAEEAAARLRAPKERPR